MAAIIFTLLLAIQACIGKSVNSECCGSKTVGNFDYTLVTTTVDFPDECLNSCAYSRDDSPGSLFCFANGDQPVTCTDFCFPGPPGPTGCPPEVNLKITDYPSTLGYRPSSHDCWDFCRALCPPVISPPCQCFAWTYNTKDKMCSTFDSLPACYGTIQEDGWISGAPCHESHTAPIKEFEEIPGDFEQQAKQYGPFGALPGTTVNFTDDTNNNPITKIEVWTGDVNGFEQVIVGIQFTYNGVTPKPHGNTTGTATQTCTIQKGTFFTNIVVRSTQSTSDPQSSLVYYLQFASTDQNMKPQICNAGDSTKGTETSISVTDKNPELSFIFGKVTVAKSSLASLSFVYNAAA